ncbi:winged helix-turn-helix domain-containing protein [Nesterenkonia natronophila]|uniref:ArsR family transcriptional regulator n=1 Tax=Nesterenkonia natronophila TaxID=2174932 RepID=A0A3A4F2E7_9MICC|nr:helix-turn-helix domain-containing protein [Nesterenkonia natronophila]RJN31901.1 ArsR family transcriptional regulator [Nesterenkonia natronophila]
MSESRSTAERFAENAQVKDVRTLKAFTHPLRMRILDYLNDREDATSTTLAKHLNESTGQTSYHLRQLEKFGLVEEIAGKGTGRERWWRSKGLNVAPEDAQALAQQTPLLRTLAQRQTAERAEKLSAFQGRLAEEEAAWVEASAMTTISTPLTAAELAAFRNEVWDVADRHTEAAKSRRDAGESDGRRRVRIHFDAFPLPEDDAAGED